MMEAKARMEERIHATTTATAKARTTKTLFVSTLSVMALVGESSTGNQMKCIHQMQLIKIYGRREGAQYLQMTMSLAFARIAEFKRAGPTWHWYSASSEVEAFDILRL